MKKTNWIYVSSIASIIAFILSLILIGSWKLSLVIAVISGVITLLFNPVRRYEKLCWASFSSLITVNTFSLDFAINFFNENSIGKVETELGAKSITLTLLLFLLCVFFGLLDYLERKDIKKLNFIKLIRKGNIYVKNKDKVKKQVNIKENKGKIEI